MFPPSRTLTPRASCLTLAAKPMAVKDVPLQFSDAEEAMDDLALLETPPDEQLDRELDLADRSVGRQ